MAKKSDFRPAREFIERLPKDRLLAVQMDATRMLRDIHLAEIRKSLSITQTTVAAKTGLKQGEVSRIERAPETVQLKTLERYVKGLGGEMKVVASFPDGTQAEIPLHHGKPVRSRVSAETASQPHVRHQRPAR